MSEQFFKILWMVEVHFAPISLLVGICMGIIRSQGFLGGARWISSIHRRWGAPSADVWELCYFGTLALEGAMARIRSYWSCVGVFLPNTLPC